MATIVFNQFNGEAPKVHPLQLSEGFAQIAKNTRLDRGRLEPFHGNLATGVTSPASTKTIFLYEGQHWFTSTSEIDYVRAPLDNDPYKYIVFAGTDFPRITRNDTALVSEPYPTSSYRLGVPAPDTQPTVALGGTTPESPDPADQETVSYIHTFVDAWGRESPPSISSPSVDVYFPDEYVTVGLDSPPAGAFQFGSGAKKRIYRSNSGTDSAAFQFVAEVDINTTSHLDSKESSFLGEVVPSVTWDGPPDDDTSLYPDGPLFWMGAMPNSFLVGITKREICFSEVNVLHGWPVDYRRSISDEVVGAAIVGQGVLVVTKANPYVCFGSDPSSMSLSKLESNQSCTNKDSLVTLEDLVLYASPDGICGFVGGRIQVLTEDIISQDEWTDLNPSSIKAFPYEGKYIGFYDATGSGGTRGGFMFDPRGGKNSFVFLDFYADAGFHYDDNLYLSLTNNTIAKFNKNTGTPMAYQYKTRRVQLAQATNFSVLKVLSKTYPFNVIVNAYYDEVLVDSTMYAVDSAQPIYLNSGFIANSWELEFNGTEEIMFAQLANSWEEM